jgi:NADH dehydrogenase [ubiquinone] 1 alpha subcomplex assembly factor 6
LPSYLQVGYIPKSAQDAYIALHAFNVDIARIGDSTSHETVALMRMQFWKDAVTKALDGSPPQEPAAILLAKAEEDLRSRTNGKYGLKKSWLHRIVKAREQYLGNRPFSTLESLETYAEQTYSTLLYLALSALPLHSITADHLASHMGKAAGISAVLRGVPLLAFPPQTPTHHTSNTKGGPLDSAPQGAILLPLDVMAECNVQQEQVLRQGSAAPNLKDAVFKIATRANDHLITAKEMIQNLRLGKDVGHEYEYSTDVEHVTQNQSGVEKQLQEFERAFPVLMRAVAVSSWLSQLEKQDFDVFSPSLRKMHWKLPFSLYMARMRQMI